MFFFSQYKNANALPGQWCRSRNFALLGVSTTVTYIYARARLLLLSALGISALLTLLTLSPNPVTRSIIPHLTRRHTPGRFGVGERGRSWGRLEAFRECLAPAFPCVHESVYCAVGFSALLKLSKAKDGFMRS